MPPLAAPAAAKPLDDEALLARIDQLLAAGRLGQATDFLSAEAARRPDRPLVLTLLGMIALQTGDRLLGLGCLERVAELTPDDADALRRLAEAQTSAGRPAAARETYADLLVTTCDDAGLCRSLAAAELAVGEDRAAERALRRAEALEPTRLSSLLIEVTTHCNLKCAGCLRTIRTDEGTWHNRHMSLEDVARVVDASPPAGELIPQGVGEPTLHPELPEIIGLARASGKFESIAFTTNALTRSVEYFAELFAAGLSYINISVDSLEADLAEELRSGTRVDKLRERVRELAARFPVVIFVTVGRRNIDHLPRLLAELEALRPWRVNLHPFDDMGRPENVLDAEEKAALSAVFPALAAQFPGLTCELHGFGPQSGACPVLWNSPAVTVDGALTPCCRLLDSEQFSFGSVIDLPFERVWTSAGRARWMDEFGRRRPAACVGCDWYPEGSEECDG